jgi:Tfp pilus assembly protein PilF
MRVQLSLASTAQACLWLALLAGAAAFAQNRPAENPNPGRMGGGSGHTLRGKLFLPSGGLPEQRIRVTLELNSGGIAGEVFSDSVGNFEFRALSSNTYRVTVHGDGRTYETTQEQVEVSGNFSRTFTVQVYLRAKGEEMVAKPKGKTLSAAEFTQDVPKAAKKLYEQGLKRWKDGKDGEALSLFEEALKVFPDYVLALNKLGESHLRQSRVAEAQAAFERAVAVSPKYPLSRINLGMIFVQSRRFAEAVEQLEAANHADESYPMAHYYLGVALMEREPADFARAELEMQRALALGGPGMASARLQLFNLYVRREDYHHAAAELEAYLKDAPGASNASLVREKLAAVKKAAADQPPPPKRP